MLCSCSIFDHVTMATQEIITHVCVFVGGVRAVRETFVLFLSVYQLSDIGVTPRMTLRLSCQEAISLTTAPASLTTANGDAREPSACCTAAHTFANSNFTFLKLIFF